MFLMLWYRQESSVLAEVPLDLARSWQGGIASHVKLHSELPLLPIPLACLEAVLPWLNPPLQNRPAILLLSASAPPSLSPPQLQ